MPPNEPNSPFVFIAYASEDADAAKRIYAGLTAAGIFAWVDQNGLKGGDVWDAKIKRLIDTCTLFVPVLSADSVSRDEGYYRQEWRQAADRRKRFADGVPFILPVSVDDTSTRDVSDRVPAEFLDAQWMALEAGRVTTDCVSLVKGILAARAPASRGKTVPAPVPIGVPSGLVNISVRLLVGSNENTPVFGFVVSGVHPRRYLIRGVGPSLARFGVPHTLSDPSLLVHSGGGTAIAKNSGWTLQGSQTTNLIRGAAERVGAFSLSENSDDAALLLSVPPGAYSVILQSATGAGGLALLEIYEVPEQTV